jgi:hypothetical protein
VLSPRLRPSPTPSPRVHGESPRNQVGEDPKLGMKKTMDEVGARAHKARCGSESGDGGGDEGGSGHSLHSVTEETVAVVVFVAGSGTVQLVPQVLLPGFCLDAKAAQGCLSSLGNFLIQL